LDLAGATALIIRRLIMPLAMTVAAIHAGQVFAQGAFPAPLPGQAAAQGAFPAPLPGQAAPSTSPFPPVNGAPRTSFPTNGAPPIGGAPPGPPSQAAGAEECMKDFLPLREEAEKRGNLIKAASERKAPPDEACKLIKNFSQAELKMLKYVESHVAKCGIPPEVPTNLKHGHKNTETMQKKVCDVAEQQKQKGPAGPSLSDVLGSSAVLPEATATKKGGSTFDTLNGNVLTR
jgi:hypothetical protein